MTILWCGGEDIDFPNGVPPTADTTGGTFRVGYGRCSLYGNTSFASARSLQFAGGSITSGWIHAQSYGSTFTSNLGVGFGQLSAGNVGLCVGTDSSSSTKCGLWQFNGGSSTRTQIAAESGNSIPGTALNQFDMQVVNFGASATVRVYVNKVLVITYSGNSAFNGMAAMDCALIFGTSGTFTRSGEIIVADADTRTLSLVTMAPNAAGDNNNWDSGTFASINPTTINDANNIAVATTAKDFQANLIDLPSGSFTVAAVKIAARAQVQAGATPTSLKLGVRESGTNYLDGGHTLTTSWATYESLLTTNPATSAAWLQSAMNPLQLELQSA
jgi:hypothetical protein